MQYRNAVILLRHSIANHCLRSVVRIKFSNKTRDARGHRQKGTKSANINYSEGIADQNSRTTIIVNE